MGLLGLLRPTGTSVEGVLAAALLLWLGVQTASYVPVWTSNLTVWGWVVAHAPDSPRGRINYGGALVSVGRFDEALRQFRAAGQASQNPTLPLWVRYDAARHARQNLDSLLTFAEGPD